MKNILSQTKKALIAGLLASLALTLNSCSRGGGGDDSSTGGGGDLPNISTAVILSIAKEAGTLKISWNKAENATKYEIYRSTTSGDNGAKLTTIEEQNSTISYLDTTLTNSGTYYYSIKACNSIGCSNFSNQVSKEFTAPISAPTAVTLSIAKEAGTLKISWNKAENATKYEIYRSTTSGDNGAKLTTIEEQNSTISYLDTTLTNSGTYYYSIKACNSIGCSNFSNQVSKEFTAPISAPTAVTLSIAKEAGTLKISWNKAENATKYEIYRSTTSGDNGAKLTTIEEQNSTISYLDTTLTNSGTYYYSIKACNSIGCSNFSNQVSKEFTAPISAPTAVTLSIAKEADTLKISWNKAENATKYEIYRSTTSGDNGAKLADSQEQNSTVSYLDDTLTNKFHNGIYYYSVKACNSVGCSSFSNQVFEEYISLVTNPILKTGQTTSYVNFDDGYYQKGVDRSYTRSSSGVVTDNITNLMWQDNIASVGKTWNSAITYCSTLSLGGYSDWRLPRRAELLSIVDWGRYNSAIDSTFINTISSNYWSSSTYVGDTSFAWAVSFYNGNTNYDYNSKSASGYVRCTRGRQ